MKKIVFLIAMLMISMPLVWSQSQGSNIPLIGSQAPSFTAKSTNGTITFPDDFGKSWKILFSHPKDFTPVCSSEILELANLQPEFDKMNVKVAVLSTDDLKQHETWKAALEEVNYKDRPTPPIKFPIIDDNDKSISKMYGMLHSPTSTTEDVRGVFVIDPSNEVRAVFFYPHEVGRNMDEIVRTVEALQIAKNNVVIPANWEPGQDVMLSYLTDEQKNEMKLPTSNIYQIAWFMTMQKLKSN